MAKNITISAKPTTPLNSSFNHLMTSITFVLCPNMLATSVTLPLEMLRAAWEMAKVKSPKLAPLSVSFRSEQGLPVETHTGLTLPATALDKPLSAGSLVFLPALWRNPINIIEKQAKTSAWLKDIAPHHTIAAVGTGVCLLAETGMLDHKPATTHWHFFNAFARRYPKVQLKRDLFITRHDRIFCTASINALAELTAFFIQEQFGLRIAQAVERNFFHEIRQPLTQAGLNIINPATTNELVALATATLDEQLLNAIQNQCQPPLNISALASSLSVSVRSLNRHFKTALNISPLQYVQNKRMSIAKDLLKTSNLAIADVANHAGFQDPQHFSRLFKKLYHIPPKQYRETVRSKLFT